MKIIILVCALFISGCSDSPEALKHTDKKKLECKEACSPRKMKSWDPWTDCHCEVE